MTSYSWKSAVSGNWTTAADWTPAGGPPGAADTVTIAASGAAYTVSLTSADAAGALTLSSAAATLAVGAGLTVGGALDLAAGTIDLQAAGALTVEGLLTNDGTIEDAAAGANLTFGAPSGFLNQGLLDVREPTISKA
jgi:hypothetical protein